MVEQRAERMTPALSAAMMTRLVAGRGSEGASRHGGAPSGFEATHAYASSYAGVQTSEPIAEALALIARNLARGRP